jgi:hypothetical protein
MNTTAAQISAKIKKNKTDEKTNRKEVTLSDSVLFFLQMEADFEQRPLKVQMEKILLDHAFAFSKKAEKLGL